MKVFTVLLGSVVAYSKFGAVCYCWNNDDVMGKILLLFFYNNFSATCSPFNWQLYVRCPHIHTHLVYFLLKCCSWVPTRKTCSSVLLSVAAWYALLLLLFIPDQIVNRQNEWVESSHCSVSACYYDWFESETHIAWRACSDRTSSQSIAKCFKSIDLPELQHSIRPLTCLPVASTQPACVCEAVSEKVEADLTSTYHNIRLFPSPLSHPEHPS